MPRLCSRFDPRWSTLVILCTGMMMIVLDNTVVNVALSSIQHELGFSAAYLAWPVNAYMIAFGGTLLLAGRLGDLVGTKRIFTVGIFVFTVASLLCGLSNSQWMLIAARFIQGLGGAMAASVILAMIFTTFADPGERAKALSIFSFTASAGGSVGLLVGGVLTQMLNWHWIFLVNVPIGLLALLVGWIQLPRIPGHDVPVPRYWAAALITIGIGALTFAIVKLQDWGWNSHGVSLSFAVALTMLSLFVAHCARSTNPFIDPALFRIRDFTRATLTMAPFSTAFGGFLLSLVLWQEGVWHWHAMKIGLAIAPGPFMVPVTSLLLAGRLIARFGAVMVVAAGLIIFTAGVIVWAVLAGPHADLAFAVLCVIPSGIGVGLTLPTLMGLGTSALPASSLATGSGVINMVRQIGFAIGVAIFVAIIGSPGSTEAYMAAFRVAWWVMAVIAVLGLIPLLLQLRWRRAVTAMEPT